MTDNSIDKPFAPAHIAPPYRDALHLARKAANHIGEPCVVLSACGRFWVAPDSRFRGALREFICERIEPERWTR